MKIFRLEEINDCGCGGGPLTVGVYSTLDKAKAAGRQRLVEEYNSFEKSRARRGLKTLGEFCEPVWTNDIEGQWWESNLTIVEDEVL